MIEQKHEKWIRKKFPIFYTIKVSFQDEFTPTELDSLESDLVINRQQVSKQNQKAFKKLKKLANQTEKAYRSNKQLYNLLCTVNSEEIYQITLGNNKIQCLKPLQKRKFLKLSEIDLAFNQIEDFSPLTTSSLPSLVYFNLTQNNLKQLKGLETCIWPKLKVLNLSHNQITSIEPLSHGQFVSLQKLDMEENFITKISSFHKSSSWELKLLSFKNNRINSLNKIQRFRFTKLSEFNLNVNPICNAVDIEKLQMTTVKNKKYSQSQTKINPGMNDFVDHSYKLTYSRIIHLFKKEDLLLDFLEDKLSRNPLRSSKHAQFALVEGYHQPEQKALIMPTKKIHFN